MSDLSEFSCGHSCIIAKPQGMATNGGCQHLDGRDQMRRREVMLAFRAYRDLLAAAERVVEAARECIASYWREPMLFDSENLGATEDALAAYDAAKKEER